MKTRYLLLCLALCVAAPSAHAQLQQDLVLTVNDNDLNTQDIRFGVAQQGVAASDGVDSNLSEAPAPPARPDGFNAIFVVPEGGETENVFKDYRAFDAECSNTPAQQEVHNLRIQGANGSGATVTYSLPAGVTGTFTDTFGGFVVSAAMTGNGSVQTNGGTAAYIMTIDYSCASLPVELTRFEARLESGVAVLEWDTASETNNDGFAIEHTTLQRLEGEGTTWNSIGWMPGAGTTLDANTYTFRASELQAGVHRFRLRQIDLDGATSLSSIVEVSIVSSEPELEVFPNPARDAVSVRVAAPQDGRVVVSVYSLLGERIAILADKTVDTSTQTFNWNIGGIASGVYLVRVETHSGTRTQRLVVTR